jgi:hypothetical protein
MGVGAMKRLDTPFPRHWVYYVALKIAVLAAALAIASYIFIHYWT